MSKFWSLVEKYRQDIRRILFEFHEPSDSARCVVGDESSAFTEYTVEQDIDMSIQHQSPRLRLYLLAAADSTYEIVHRLLSEDSQPLRAGSHPLPA